MATASVKKILSNQEISLLEMGETARGKGNFERARRLLRLAMRDCLHNQSKKDKLVQIAVCLGATYFDETNYERAETWYKRALQISMLLHGETTMQAACLLTKLAELCILQSRFDQCHTLFENAQNIYLLSNSEEVQPLLDSLIDLSWALCVKNRASDAREVNILVSHIKEECIESTAGSV